MGVCRKKKHWFYNAVYFVYFISSLKISVIFHSFTSILSMCSLNKSSWSSKNNFSELFSCFCAFISSYRHALFLLLFCLIRLNVPLRHPQDDCITAFQPRLRKTLGKKQIWFRFHVNQASEWPLIVASLKHLWNNDIGVRWRSAY